MCSSLQAITALCSDAVKKMKLNIQDITSMSMTPSPGGSPRCTTVHESLKRESHDNIPKGAPAEKLTVGMPTFGHGWELMDENEVSI